jgi:hypothetical protein
MKRRTFLATMGIWAAGSWLPRRGQAQPAKTRLILLGTGGGPRPRKASSASAQVIVVNGTAYVVIVGKDLMEI